MLDSIPSDDIPSGFDLAAEDSATEGWWDEFMESGPSLRNVYRSGEAAGFKRGFEAARAQLLRAMAEVPICAEPAPLRIEGPKPAPTQPEPAPTPPVAAPEPRPFSTIPVAAPPPAAPTLPLWSTERDEMLAEGWTCWISDTRIAAAVSHLPGPQVHTAEIARRAIVIRCQRTGEYAAGCVRIQAAATARGLNWSDTIGLIYDFILGEDVKKREAKRQAKAEALSTSAAPVAKNPAAVELGRKGGQIGGAVRAAGMSKEERSAAAKTAADARWTRPAEPLGERLTPERKALLEREYPGGVATKAILARFNGLPGRKLDEGEMRVLANELGLRRPVPFDWKTAPDEMPADLPSMPVIAEAATPVEVQAVQEPPHDVLPSPPPPPPAAMSPKVETRPTPSPPPAFGTDVRLPAPSENGKIYAPLHLLMQWAKAQGFGGFDGSNVDALNRWCVATLRPSVVVEG